MLEHMYITIPVHEKIFLKQGQVHPEGLKNSSEIAPFFQYSFNTHSIPFKASPFPHFSPQNPCIIQVNALRLHHKNPPSLSTMLKSAGRFFY